METVQQNGRLTLFPTKFPSNIYSILYDYSLVHFYTMHNILQYAAEYSYKRKEKFGSQVLRRVIWSKFSFGCGIIVYLEMDALFFFSFRSFIFRKTSDFARFFQ